MVPIKSLAHACSFSPHPHFPELSRRPRSWLCGWYKTCHGLCGRASWLSRLFPPHTLALVWGWFVPGLGAMPANRRWCVVFFLYLLLPLGLAKTVGELVEICWQWRRRCGGGNLREYSAGSLFYLGGGNKQIPEVFWEGMLCVCMCGVKGRVL